METTTEVIVTMTSAEFGTEEFRYDTEAEAEAGVERLQQKAAELGDGITREYRIDGELVSGWFADSQRERLEYLRGELRAERISYGESSELQSLTAYIDPGDVELLEVAGVPEFGEDDDIPADFPVRSLRPTDPAKDRVTCGTCERSWDDSIPTSMTPAPSARCPFEEFHEDDEVEEFGEGREQQARDYHLKAGTPWCLTCNKAATVACEKGHDVMYGEMETTPGDASTAPRYDFVTITGRFKVIDHHAGQQIATADDEESARLILRGLNSNAALVDALREARQWASVVTWDNNKQFSKEAKVTIAKIDAALRLAGKGAQ